MGGVTVSGGAGTQAQFGIAAVNTGLLSDRFASAGGRFPLNRSPHRIVHKQRQDINAKTEHGRRRSPILTASNPLPFLNSSTERQGEFSSKRRLKASSRAKAVAFKKDDSCAIPISEVDYGEAAAALEDIYNDSPASVSGSDLDTSDQPQENKGRRRKKKVLRRHETSDAASPKRSGPDAICASAVPLKARKAEDTAKKTHKRSSIGSALVVRSPRKYKKRLSLDSRIALRKARLARMQSRERAASLGKNKLNARNEDPDIWSEEVDQLIKGYLVSTDLISLDWNKLQTRGLLSPAEHIWLAELMQPMKSYLQTKETLKKVLRREPRDDEIAKALNVPARTFKRQMEAGQAARNKMMQHNLRLVLFEVYKHNLEVTGLGFHDACQEGTKGLLIAVDRFEPKKGFRLSTYALYWIRYSILRAITLSSLRRTSFTVAALKLDIQRATLDLLFQLGRAPTDEEIRSKLGLKKERYDEVVRASRRVLSLNEYDRTTKEELINTIIDQENGNHTYISPQTMLRLGLDDVLDSLKPKENLVIRQRFGLDGKGGKSLGEIARNLNISREMVRKYEVKGLLKLKHPSRVEYLRSYLV